MEFPVKETDEVALCWPYGKPACLNVSLLQRIHKAAPDSFGLVEIALTEEIYDTCVKGVAEWKIKLQPDAKLHEPGYLCWFKEENNAPSYMIADGNHRITRRYRSGVRTMNFWACWPPVWEHVIVPLTPEEAARIVELVRRRMEGPAALAVEFTEMRQNCKLLQSRRAIPTACSERSR